MYEDMDEIARGMRPWLQAHGLCESDGEGMGRKYTWSAGTLHDLDCAMRQAPPGRGVNAGRRYRASVIVWPWESHEKAGSRLGRKLVMQHLTGEGE